MEENKISQTEKTRVINLLKKHKSEILFVSTSDNYSIESVSDDDPAKIVVMLKKV